MDGFVVWITGLPGSGKTALAKEIEPLLKKRGHNCEILDGNEVRALISSELGFTEEDRKLHNRRVIHIAKLLARNGVGVIVSLISPYRETRAFARRELPNFVEVWTKCPLEVCEARDKKGLYEKARRGEITDLTGVQHPYEEPENPEVIVDTEKESPSEGARRVIDKLEELGLISAYTKEEEEAVKRRLEDLGYLG
ncbi:MAG TPA: adenylyl-sulfate kinase [bacterium (Candidatus Stahlbacteria)]|nr:adenylyl-sulfate kinase [Candidatus Stahlbacteria bacterium]